MPLTIVDSDILIDVARGESEAITCLLGLEQTSALAISVVSQLELIVGCRNKKELQDLDKFLNRFRILKVTDRISDRAANLLTTYFLSHGLLIADAFIGRDRLGSQRGFYDEESARFSVHC